MKILQIIHSLNPGGAERLVVDLCNQLSSDPSDEIYLVTLKNRSEKNEDFYLSELSSKVSHVKLNFGDGFNPIYMLQVLNVLREIEPDVVHIHCVLNYLFPTIFLYRKPRYVMTLHNIPEIGLPGVLKNVTRYLAKNELLKVATISDTNRRLYQEYVGLRNDELVYNGRSIPLRTSNFDETKAFVNSLKKDAGSFVFLSIAKCNPQKNLKLLVEAVNKLTSDGYTISLLVLGDGYKTQQLGLELQEMAGDNIHFLGPKTNVSDFYLLSDAFCMSSTFEGMPITLLEALSLSCMPVCTPVSGVVDILRDGVTGFVAEDFSLDAYITVIKRFIENRDIINPKNLTNLFEERFSIVGCAKKYRDVFHQLVKTS